MKVAIVGGGIVGIFSALYLQEAGHDVTVFERGNLGEGSVHAAGLIEPFRFDRINTIGMVRKMVSYAARGVTVVRSVEKSWLMALARELEKEPPRYAWEKVREMGYESLTKYKAMAEERNDFSYREDGLVEVYESPENLNKAIEEERRSPLSPKFEVVDFHDYAGGILFPELSSISTEEFIQRAYRELKRVRIMEGTEVSTVTQEGEVSYGSRREKFEKLVVAGGVWCSRLGVPVTGFKGYGIRVTTRSPWTKERPFVLGDAGVAFTPTDKWIKVTAGFDLDTDEREDRKNYPVAWAKRVLGDVEVIDTRWGRRPCSPDGFPVICHRENLIVATGNCRLGWSFAPSMGRIVKNLIDGNNVEGISYFSRFCPQRT